MAENIFIWGKPGINIWKYLVLLIILNTHLKDAVLLVKLTYNIQFWRDCRGTLPLNVAGGSIK